MRALCGWSVSAGCGSFELPVVSGGYFVLHWRGHANLLRTRYILRSECEYVQCLRSRHLPGWSRVGKLRELSGRERLGTTWRVVFGCVFVVRGRAVPDRHGRNKLHELRLRDLRSFHGHVNELRGVRCRHLQCGGGGPVLALLFRTILTDNGGCSLCYLPRWSVSNRDWSERLHELRGGEFLVVWSECMHELRAG